MAAGARAELGLRDERGLAHRDVVVVGASAGGVEALTAFVQRVPPELPASVFVVLHLLATGTSVLHSILARAGRLPTSLAVDGERYERGHIYVARPDHHLLIGEDRIILSSGPRENGHRPAIDPLFRSAARALGPRVIAVVLSGSLDDGAAGTRFVKERGGLAIVQAPDDALYSTMPEAAASATDVDYVGPVSAIPGVLCSALEREIKPEEFERASNAERPPLQEEAEGTPSTLTCPDCGGALWEHDEGRFVRFSCRTGHAYSPESLATEQGNALETALWSALRSLEERADLLQRMQRRAGGGVSGERFGTRIRAIDQHAQAIRDAIEHLGFADRATNGDRGGGQA